MGPHKIQTREMRVLILYAQGAGGSAIFLSKNLTFCFFVLYFVHRTSKRMQNMNNTNIESVVLSTNRKFLLFNANGEQKLSHYMINQPLMCLDRYEVWAMG